MLLGLAFVLEADVGTTFNTFRHDCPNFLAVFDDFKEYYVTGRPAKARRVATAPRFTVSLWNQHETALNQSHPTNNISEGWHNRFRIVIGKHLPDLYTPFEELQKKQGYIEICVTEVALDKRVKVAFAKKWIDLQTRTEVVAGEYNIRPRMEYLRANTIS